MDAHFSVNGGCECIFFFNPTSRLQLVGALECCFCFDIYKLTGSEITFVASDPQIFRNFSDVVLWLQPLCLHLCHCLCLVGLVVKVSVSRVEDPGFESHLRQHFSESSHTCDLNIGTLVATLPGAWCSSVSTVTGRPGVSIL